MLVEAARAKLNLTLAVRGRRTDGYHELDSLVAFASAGDQVSLSPGTDFAIEAFGPSANAITDDNLITKAARLAREAEPSLLLGRFHLKKTLPVAAGLGGGSADAAAALRLIARANPGLGSPIDWNAIARRIGADVTVCLVSRASRMSGLGEQVSPLRVALPPVSCVLANPGVPLATPPVFRALAAPLFDGQPVADWPELKTTEDLLAFVRAGRNDLEPAAISLCPLIADVLAALANLAGAEVVRMSGSGPTCFALFRTLPQADAARAALSASRPDWWVVAAELQ